jgi:type I restriction enzyme, R subunit
MTSLTESSIEKYVLTLLKQKDYNYLTGPTIAPDSETPARQSFEEVLLLDRLRECCARINPTVPAEVREDARGVGLLRKIGGRESHCRGRL